MTYRSAIMATCACAMLGLAMAVPAHAQLNPGDMMFVGYNADTTDGFTIVALADLPANTLIHFNDNEWNGSDVGAGGAFTSSTEGEITWHTGDSEIEAGTVVDFQEVNNESNAGYGASIGSLRGSLNLNATNEVLYAFTGPDSVTPSQFLTAFANDQFSSSFGTLNGTGLTSGINALEISGDEDILVYYGPTNCGFSPSACLSALVDPANWATQDGGGNQANDGTFPDIPADLIDEISSSTLPVVWGALNGVWTSEQSVLIEWEVLAEENHSFYLIERTTEYGEWEFLDLMIKSTHSGHSRIFKAEDLAPSPGISYYRIRQVDIDGSYSFSPIVAVQSMESPSQGTGFPNPCDHTFTLQFPAGQVGTLKILDALGRQVQQLVSIEETQLSSIRLSVADLAPGRYVVQLGGLYWHMVKQ
ncbi:T9SS type A sorting domain-containing protein [Pontibacter sp. G13]|uniref:T9SS type A sorting domain-containing protein n=1 Tax=Pontibacter sp. G13 TaxID=3074898 RepID=UPI0028894042|nr:T9SS type A sorting domain-containing protein [Pontibacter sp. G13]WNJ18032.1 T9SS type A sorting domain-containing protein [Pontibacter sp. G13]